MADVTVSGTVARLNSVGNGFSVLEENEYQGKVRKTYWSVFPPKDAPRPVSEVGQPVKVSGRLGTRVSERDARFVDHTLNQAKVLEAAQVAPAKPQWDSATPF